jgi:hypothetical protein
MLKSVIICTAIATFAMIPQARAQYPYPGGVDLNSRQQDPDWSYQHRNDYGTQSYQDHLNAGRYNSIPGEPYQPYPSVSPSIRPLNDYGIGSHHRGLYGDD